MIIDGKLVSAVKRKAWDIVEKILYNYWIEHCPQVYQPKTDEVWNIEYDENLIERELIHPLAAAYCLDVDVHVDLDRLNEQCGKSEGEEYYKCEENAIICGKAFRNGDIMFTCTDCASDPMCVFCQECFFNSAHTSHKHKISSSSGLGYCDCGDAEAWKNGATCDKHKNRRPNNCSKEVIDRISSLTLIVLRFAYRLICYSDNELPSSIRRKQAGQCRKPYYAVFYNSESHTYESVIRTLVSSISCDDSQSMRMARTVDREGRSIICCDSFDSCERVKEEIQRRTRNDSNRTHEPLDVRVMASNLVALQDFGIHLIGWLSEQCSIFSQLGMVIGRLLLSENLFPDDSDYDAYDTFYARNDTFVRIVLKFDRSLWKTARQHNHQLLMKTVLMHDQQRALFAREFVKLYRFISDEYTEDDHHRCVSIMSLAVQIFTTPTIARMLIAEEEAFSAIILSLEFQFQRYRLDCDGSLRYDFSERLFPMTLRRALDIFNDYCYLLYTVPKCDEWTTSLKDHYLNGTYSFISFLTHVENMDQVRRLVVEHQHYEKEWEAAFLIQLRMQRCLKLTVTWTCSDAYVHRVLMQKLLNDIDLFLKNGNYFPMKRKSQVFDNSAYCIPYDVGQDPISFHHPLFRLLAGLFTAPYDYLADIAECSTHVSLSNDLTLVGRRALLCEHALRSLVANAQHNAQMWRRNGNSFANQVFNYSTATCRTEMYDRDILMVQAMAALTPPDIFMVRFIHKFNLISWCMGQYEFTMNNLHLEDSSKQVVTLVEEMFHLLIIIIGERFLPGVGKVDSMVQLRREVLHMLAIGSKQFSALQDPNLSRSFSNIATALEVVAHDVGGYVPPNQDVPGSFVMKDSVATEFNSFFYHYTKINFSEAHQYQRQRRASMSREIQACFPPMPPPFEPFFAPIVNLLRSNVLLSLLNFALGNYAQESQFSSDGLLHRVLFLVGMGLNEQKSCAEFRFIESAEETGLFTMLEQLSSCSRVVGLNSLLLDSILKIYKKHEANAGVGVGRDSILVKSPVESGLRARKAVAARTRKQALLQMARMQEKFAAVNKEFVGEGSKNVAEKKIEEALEDEFSCFSLLNGEFPVCLGKNRSLLNFEHGRVVYCILCREFGDVRSSDTRFVLTAHVRRSTLFRQSREDNDELNSMLFMPANVPIGLLVSTCGHAMHFSCYANFASSYTASERNPSSRRFFDISSGDYLCPLCKRVSNSIMPILPLPSMLDEILPESGGKKVDFEQWIDSMVDSDFWPTNRGTHGRKRAHSKMIADNASKEVALHVPSSSSLPDSSDEIDRSPSPTLSSILSSNLAEGALNSNEQSTSHHHLSLPPNIIRRVRAMTQSRVKSSDTDKCDLDNASVVRSFYFSQMVQYFRISIRKHGMISTTCGKSTSEVILCWQSTAYTLRALCAALREENKPLFGAFTKRQSECVYYFSRVSAVAAFNMKPRILYDIMGNLLAPLLFDFDAHGYSPLWSQYLLAKGLLSQQAEAEKHNSAGLNLNLLQVCAIDMLSLAIELSMCCGWLSLKRFDTIEQFAVPRGSFDEYNCIQLTLLGLLFQVFATFDESSEVPLASEQQVDNCLELLIPHLYSLIHPSRTISSIVLLAECLKSAAVEFLRPLALLYHSLTLVPPPEALKDPSIKEFESLCRYMGFSPNLFDILSGAVVESCFTRWSRNQNKHRFLGKMVCPPVRVKSLIDLPTEFSTLLSQASNFRCSSSTMKNHSSSAPTLCLLCGELLCSQSYCCQKAPNQPMYETCNIHLQHCSGPSGGIFLRIRDCRVILLLPKSQAYHTSAPYIDQFGEYDFGFRRCLPLRLSLDHYAKLKSMWFNQLIVERVVDYLETEQRPDMFEWEMIF